MNLKIIYICLLSFIDVGVFGKNVRIIGGMSAGISEFKFLVSMRNVKNNIHFCAGSIITNRFILTAAHCFMHFDEDRRDIRIYAGTTGSRDITEPAYTIDEIIPHHDFTGTLNLENLTPHDIALVKTEQEIEFNERTKKVDLPSRDIFIGNIGVVAGWGLTAFPGLLSASLRKASLEILDKDSCQIMLPVTVQDYHLCTFYSPDVATCEGDSGGPVLSNGELYGVISSRFNYNLRLPELHTKVYYYLEFIRFHISQ